MDSIICSVLRNTEWQCSVIWLTDWLTNSMEHSTPWEANKSSASQTIPAFHGTRSFITSLTSALQLPLSQARLIHSTPSRPTSWISSLILSSHLHLGLPSGLFPSVLSTKLCMHLFCPPHVSHAQPICSVFELWYEVSKSMMITNEEMERNK